jgi:hydrogenase nickel incorporation protein HypA/HybF
MHETAVVSGLMRILVDQAKANKITKITSVRLTIGRLRGLDIRQIRGAFEIFSEETIAEGARLDINDLAVRAHCKACATAFDVPNYRFECPACGSSDADVVQGRELFIESFEGEKTPPTG